MLQAAPPLLKLSVRFWTGPQAQRAWLLTIGSISFALGDVGMQLLLNQWNRRFFDAVEHRSVPALETAVYQFAILVVLATATVMAATLCKILLQVAWRRQLTGEAIKAWLSDQAFYRLNILRGTSFGPEHRIAEDVRLTIEPIADLAIGALSALLTTLTFASILWSVGGSFEIAGVTIPGFMVFLGIANAAGVTALMSIFGRNYTRRIRDRSEAEARFRYELTRIREHAESVALLRGERGERLHLDRYLKTLVTAWDAYAVVWTQMTWVTYTNGLVAPVLPLLVMMPKYLSGDASLGVMMQTATAFGVFQGSLGWFMSNYARLSEWYAAATRVGELLTFIDLAGNGAAPTQIDLVDGTDEYLRLTNLTVRLHDGATIIADTDLVVSPGDMVLVNGQSGAGKSTLIRAIAGLWPWGSGTITLPKSAKIAFLPQRPYVPNGSLRAALTYPEPPSSVLEKDILEALELTGLSQLAGALDLDQGWDKMLSGGEQQRLAFARILIHRPTLVILDEATGALDGATEARMMDLFTTQLFSTTVISVAHRASLAKYHNRVLTVHREKQGSRVSSEVGEHGLSQRMRQALASLAAQVKS